MSFLKMEQGKKSIIYENDSPSEGFEKLYLDSRTADVFFVFNNSQDEECRKVPAHKNILSAISPVFYAMFYGPAKESGDVTITDSIPEVFEEFLQLFYRSKVNLTAEHVFELMNLCKMYEIEDCVNALTDLCESNLTIDNMCLGYEFAILFGNKRLKKFCERKITENPKMIFNSNSFLNCKSNLLRHILKIDSLKCDVTVILDGCIKWAKIKCTQNGLDEKNMQNIRDQLGDLSNEIPFESMQMEKFIKCYRENEGFFSLEEYREFTIIICESTNSCVTEESVCNDQRITIRIRHIVGNSQE